MSLYQWVLENVGVWVADYPYIYASIILVLLIIILVTFQNMLYFLGRFIAGER